LNCEADPLVSAKINDFLLFKKCFELIKKGDHLNERGLLEIISLKNTLNLGVPANIKEAFKGKIDFTILPNKVPFVFKGIPDPN
jgi:hypothetical protein